MPGMDGWKVIVHMQKTYAGAAVAIIMMSAHGRGLLSKRSAQERALLPAF